MGWGRRASVGGGVGSVGGTHLAWRGRCQRRWRSHPPSPDAAVGGKRQRHGGHRFGTRRGGRSVGRPGHPAGGPPRKAAASHPAVLRQHPAGGGAGVAEVAGTKRGARRAARGGGVWRCPCRRRCQYEVPRPARQDDWRGKLPPVEGEGKTGRAVVAGERVVGRRHPLRDATTVRRGGARGGRWHWRETRSPRWV